MSSSPAVRGKARPTLATLPWLGSIGNYLSTEMVNAISTLAGVVIFTRLVRPDVYGAYALTIAAASIALTLSGEWLQTATLRLLAGQQRVNHRRVYVRALLQLTLASVGLLTVAAAVGLHAARTTLGKELVVAGWLYAALTILFQGTTICFQATFEPTRFAIYRSVYSVLRILLAAMLAALVAPSPVWLVGGSVMALLLVLPPAAFQLLREGGPEIPPGRIALARSRVVSFGLPLIGWYAASQTLNLSDRFFLQGLLGSTEVGMYSVTYSLVVGATTTLLQPILAAVYPAMVGAWQREGPAAAGRELATALRIYLLLAPLVLCGLLLFGNDVLALLAPAAYRTPRALIGILAAALLCWNAGLYLQKGLELGLRSRDLVKALSISAGVNVVANFFFIARFGLIGAACATLAGYAVYAGQVWPRSRAAMPFTFPLRAAAAGVIAGGVFIGLETLLARVPGLQTPTLRLVLVAPLAFLGYAGAVYGLGELRLRARSQPPIAPRQP